MTPSDEVVLVSRDGRAWDLPAGRTEPGESWEDTLRREMHEEACVTVGSARLLGFSRGECINGHEQGRILIRSLWRADVEVNPWDPQFEIPYRRIVPASAAMAAIGPNPFAPLIRRELYEAQLLTA